MHVGHGAAHERQHRRGFHAGERKVRGANDRRILARHHLAKLRHGVVLFLLAAVVLQHDGSVPRGAIHRLGGHTARVAGARRARHHVLAERHVAEHLRGQRPAIGVEGGRHARPAVDDARPQDQAKRIEHAQRIRGAEMQFDVHAPFVGAAQLLPRLHAVDDVSIGQRRVQEVGHRSEHQHLLRALDRLDAFGVLHHGNARGADLRCRRRVHDGDAWLLAVLARREALRQAHRPWHRGRRVDHAAGPLLHHAADLVLLAQLRCHDPRGGVLDAEGVGRAVHDADNRSAGVLPGPAGADAGAAGLGYRGVDVNDLPGHCRKS